MLALSTAARMALHLVLLPLMLAVSLVSTQQCASSVGSTLDVSVHGHKNASGDWIITVDTRRLISTEKQWELTMNVHQQRRSCDSNEIEQLVSVTSVHPLSHDSPMSGGIEVIASSSTTTNSSTTTAPSTTAITTTTNTTTPKSCPVGYQVFPGFNCYKRYAEEEEAKSWTDAREKCRRHGGDLMVMETERERDEVFLPLWENYPAIGSWVGVYSPQGEDGWITVKGDPVLNVRWNHRNPWARARAKCARALKKYSVELESWSCANSLAFTCEVPL